MSTYSSTTTQLTPALADAIGTLEGQQDALLAASCPLSSSTAAYLSTAIAIPEIETRLHFASFTSDALTSLGYAFERVDGISTTAFAAYPANQPDRAHEVLLVTMTDDQKFETDHLGLTDGACNDVQLEFIEAMKQRGVLFADEVNVQHHDPHGGTPAAIARRHDATSLARGAVLAADSNGGFTKTLYTAPSAAKSRAVESGQR